MKKKELINLIIDVFNAHIEPILRSCEIIAGIKPSGTREKLEKTLSWLGEFKDNEVKAFKDFTQTSNLWHIVLKIDDLPEVAEYKRLRNIVINKWKKRPSTIRRLYVQETKNK